MTKTYMKQGYRDSKYNCEDHGGPNLCIGKEFDFGLVLAFGMVIDEDEERCYAVLMLVPDCKRRIGWNGHDPANYAVGYLSHGEMTSGSFTNVTFYANIVEATKAYADDYGQDI